jgi:hypothetical protein
MIEPGIYEDISNDDYHEGEGISSSQVKVLALKTPAHYFWKYLDPNNEHEVKDKWGALAIGTLFHSLLLEPEKPIEREFLFVDDINRRSKAGKEAFADNLATATESGRNIVTHEEHEHVKKMVAEARKQSLFNSLFTGGRAELSCYWNDPDTGILCKCRPDYLHDDNIIVDLKSCRDADEDGAGKASFNFGYYISAAFYLDGVAAATGKPADSFIFAFMEKEPPYCAAPYVITEEDIALGRALYKQALDKMVSCTAAKRWPGYTTNITELEIPVWARKKIRHQLSKES